MPTFPAGGFCSVKRAAPIGPALVSVILCSALGCFPDKAKASISEPPVLPAQLEKLKMRRRLTPLVRGMVAQEGKADGEPGVPQPKRKSPPGDTIPESTEEAGDVADALL